MALCEDLQAFCDAVNNAVDYSMEKGSVAMVAQANIIGAVYSEVYDKYEPKVYRRQMEHGGLLTLDKGPGRSRAIRLTDAGRTLMRRAALPLVEAENAVFAAWTAQERETYLRLNACYADDFRARLDALTKESDA